MADFRPFSPRWGDISFTEAPQTTARCYAGAIFLSYSPSGRHREPAGVEGAARRGAWPRCRWAVAGPGRASARPHTKCRRCGGCRRVRRAWPRCRWAAAGPGRASRSATPSRRLACGDLAGGPPPTGTLSGQAHRTGSTAGGPPPTGTPSSPAQQAPAYAKGGGHRSTRPLSAHSATASSRLRPNDPQSWRRRRIHRNMPPTTAAPRPAPPIRPSKPVRARPFFGLVAGTSGAT